MDVKRFVVAVAVLLCCVAPANAQAVKLRFHDGLVTLATQNAPLRAILAEWARLGGATITNGERVNGAPLTLELNAVPERQAIDVLLRSVSGYMAAMRPIAVAGLGVYDRILILPTSSAPRNPPAALAQPRPTLRQPPPEVVTGVEEIEEAEEEELPVNPLVRPRSPGRPEPFVQPDPDDEPTEEQPADGIAPTPANPFGVPTGATSRPGMVTPVPQQQPQRTQPDPEP